MTDDKTIEDKYNILHKPQFDYDKNYDSVGAVDKTEYVESEKIETSIIDKLKNDIENIKQTLPFLPNDLKEIANKPLEIIESVIGDLDSIDSKPIQTEENLIIIGGIDDDGDDDDDYPETFFRDEGDPFVIVVDKKDKLTIIKETYDYDLISVIADYINKLSQVMNEYLVNIMAAFKSLDSSMYHKVLSNYNVNSSKISKDYKHLSDLVIRSQIIRNMKIRLYNKLYNLDKSISHIRACKAGVEQRLRYYEANYQKGEGLNDLLSNRLLENSRMTYDKKYKQNFFNLYKYLNSSVILLDECFKMYINEAQAKIILLTKEGNDLW